MRHPFSGIIKSEDRPHAPETLKPSRRGLFGLAAGAIAAGTFGLIAFSSTAEAQSRPRPVTRARGEEGTRRGWKK